MYLVWGDDEDVSRQSPRVGPKATTFFSFSFSPDIIRCRIELATKSSARWKKRNAGWLGTRGVGWGVSRNIFFFTSSRFPLTHIAYLMSRTTLRDTPILHDLHYRHSPYIVRGYLSGLSLVGFAPCDHLSPGRGGEGLSYLPTFLSTCAVGDKPPCPFPQSFLA